MPIRPVVQGTIITLFIVGLPFLRGLPNASNQAQEPPVAVDGRADVRRCESWSAVRVYAVRLRPGQDLRQAIEDWVAAEKIQAGFVVTCVGSLTEAHIRFAGQSEYTRQVGPLEIVSLVGTMGADGLHLHISVSDKAGSMIGGHLGKGSLVYTTAELVLGEATDLQFLRIQDPATTYPELHIQSRKNGTRSGVCDNSKQKCP